MLQEGKAKILMLKEANDVFFNKAQVVNRDLSVLSLRLFQKVRHTPAVELKASFPAAAMLASGLGGLLVVPTRTCIPPRVAS